MDKAQFFRCQFNANLFKLGPFLRYVIGADINASEIVGNEGYGLMTINYQSVSQRMHYAISNRDDFHKF